MMNILFSRSAIRGMVSRMADMTNKRASMRTAHYWVIMHGAFMFASDFLRQMPSRPVNFIHIKRGYNASSIQEPELISEEPTFFSGRRHIFIDVVTETGLTFKYLMDMLPPKLRRKAITVALVQKVVNNVEWQPSVIGFRLETDLFLSGYGMGPYRMLPYIIGYKK